MALGLFPQGEFGKAELSLLWQSQSWVALLSLLLGKSSLGKAELSLLVFW